jgi:large subunit ribosomal protein L32
MWPPRLLFRLAQQQRPELCPTLSLTFSEFLRSLSAPKRYEASRVGSHPSGELAAMVTGSPMNFFAGECESAALPALFYFCRWSVVMLPVARTSKSRKGMRRAHHALTAVGYHSCPKCGHDRLPHRMCSRCGYVRPDLGLILRDKKKNKQQDASE